MEDKFFLQNIVFNKKASNKFAFYFITLALTAIIGFAYYLFDDYHSYAPIVTQFITVALALVGLGGFFTQKRQLLKSYSQTDAYRKAFFYYHVTFIPFVYMGAIHSYFVQQPPIFTDNWFNVRYVICGYFLLSGILLHMKARKLFGVDNLFMYYVYHPNESHMVEYIIHKIIRHPVYSAMNRIAWAGAFFNGSLTSFILAFLFTCNQVAWLYFYEEPELIKRFGDGYASVKKTVPALYPKATRYIDFIKFLLGKVK